MTFINFNKKCLFIDILIGSSLWNLFYEVKRKIVPFGTSASSTQIDKSTSILLQTQDRLSSV